MHDSKFDFSVVDVELNSNEMKKDDVGAYISIGNQELDCIMFGDTDHRLVLEMGSESDNVRVTLKSVEDAHKIGSISFPAASFQKYATNETNEIWMTVFDEESDDVYDGNYQEDDTENPKVKISLTRGEEPTKHKDGATKFKSITITTKKLEPIKLHFAQKDESEYNVKTLTTELTTTLETLIENMRNDQIDIHTENNKSVDILQNLENVHDELKGEHEQDLEFANALQELKSQILEDIDQRKEEIEAQKAELLETLKYLEEARSEVENNKNKAEKNNKDLIKSLDIQEDLTESGLTDEAKDLRNQNQQNNDKIDQLTQDLINTRDGRNKIIDDHNDIVRNIEITISQYRDQLIKSSQTKKLFGYESANLMKELDFQSTQEDSDNRRLQLAEIECKSLREALDRLREEYEESDQEFNNFTDELRVDLKDQDLDISNLLKRFNAKQNQIADMKNEITNQKNNIEHFRSEINKFDQEDYEKKYTQLLGDLKEAEDIRRKHQDELENSYQGLTIKIDLFSQDIENRANERLEEAQKVIELLNNLQGSTHEINELLTQIETLESRIMSDENRDKVSYNYSAELQTLISKLDASTKVRDQSNTELQEAMESMNEKQKRLQEQKKQIDSLRKDTQELRALTQEKNNIIKELEKDIQASDDEIDALKGTVDDLHRKIADKDDEIDKLQRMIDDHNKQIALLEDQNRRDKMQEQEPAEEPVPLISYSAKKGDEVDEMIATYIQD